ncbi:hypothetical protein ACIRUK_41415, partial [Streptomyces sp. NPDC101150]
RARLLTAIRAKRRHGQEQCIMPSPAHHARAVGRSGINVVMERIEQLDRPVLALHTGAPGTAPPGRAYGFERMMDNLGAIFGPLLALGLVAWVGVQWAIGLSVIPGLLAAAVPLPGEVAPALNFPGVQPRELLGDRLARLLLGAGVGSVAAEPPSRPPLG